MVSVKLSREEPFAGGRGFTRAKVLVVLLPQVLLLVSYHDQDTNIGVDVGRLEVMAPLIGRVTILWK